MLCGVQSQSERLNNAVCSKNIHLLAVYSIAQLIACLYAGAPPFFFPLLEESSIEHLKSIDCLSQEVLLHLLLSLLR
jgi:hypothetical protein